MRKPNLALSEKHYEPGKVEDAITELWDQHEVHVADNASDKPAYSIVIPPPNVTGRLHMGHALNNTMQDLLVRYKRMDGYNVLWVPGTDHAGIATQSVVKKHLDAEGIDFRALGREKVIEKIWEWKEKYGDHILNQLRRLGCSCDWSRTRFTMDEGLSKAVMLAFKKMYDDGLIYRGKYIVNWCPVDRTALSDDEVETKDGGEPGHLWYFKYPLVEGGRFIEIATTRPETLLGDTAVAVNPKDDRYIDLIGKKVLLPLVGREIEIIADNYVDPTFGTGAVKITPAHDPNDFQLGLRHNLQMINVMNEDATMGDEAPERFHGLDRYECRKRVVAEMEEQGYLIKVEDRNVPVGRSYRSKAIIEYRLSDQWFVKMKPLAEKALELSEAGKLSYFPERWDEFYRNWLKNVRDWCISRQIWWGHRIPAWYHKETGEILVDVEVPAAVKENPELWEQDEDVLDTWFSSALWPFSTLGWPEKTKDLETYYPTSILVTAKDIIFFWVARMVMGGLYLLEEQPFREVLINSIICDEDGETMSKSKGNGIDPLHVIDGASKKDLETPILEARPANMQKLLDRLEKKFPDGFSGVGADALRYTMLTTATDAQQVHISLKRFDEVGRPFTNKIWNASKLALATLDACTGTKSAELAPEKLEDAWIIARLSQAVARVRLAFDTYNLHHATDTLYHFFWDDLCDWYLEIIKFRMREENAGDHRRIASTLSEVFLTFLKLLHPIMPFITEELWGHFQAKTCDLGLHPELCSDELCATASFPSAGESTVSEACIKDFTLLQDAVRSVRNMKAAADVAAKVQVECLLVASSPEIEERLSRGKTIIERLANLKSLQIESSTSKSTACEEMSSTVLTDMTVYLNLAEHRDVEADRARQEKALEKVQKLIAGLEGKLSNKQFVDRAPEEVVAGERLKLEEALNQKKSIEASLASLK